LAAGDLTTIEKVKRYLVLSEIGADTVLAELITSSSDWIRSETGRDLLAKEYTDTVNGNGRAGLSLASYPVLYVSGVTIGDDAIAERADYDDDGWELAGDRVELLGYSYTYGLRNVSVSYVAGYGGAVITLSTGLAAAESVTIDGTVFAAVAAGATGNQWNVGATLTASAVNLAAAITGSATAAISDVYAATSSGAVATVTPLRANASGSGISASGSHVAITAHSFTNGAVIPTDLEQAVIEHVALRFRDRGHMGIAMSAGGGEAVTYLANPGSLAFINGIVAKYQRVRL
jgi:uncharacterized phiE125 gp8 family phage protein